MERLYRVGIDITKNYIQLAYALSPGDEIISLSASTQVQKYLIPAVWYRREYEDRIYIGYEAVSESESDGEETEKLESHFDDEPQIMADFLDRLLDMLKVRDIAQEFEHICVTVEPFEMKTVKNIAFAFEKLGYGKDKFRIISHDEAFLYYALSQKKELWINDVVLMDFTRESLKVRLMEHVQRGSAYALRVREDDLTQEISFGMLANPETAVQADKKLAMYVKKITAGRTVCSVYLTGDGFYESWMNYSMKAVCERRRVFKGYNLFAKGAAAGAVAGDKHDIFLCEGRTRADIIIENIPAVRAGQNILETDGHMEFVVDRADKLKYAVFMPDTGKKTEKSVDLTQFPKREPKTARISVDVDCGDGTGAVITVKDIGFGDLFAGSGMEIREDTADGQTDTV